MASSSEETNNFLGNIAKRFSLTPPQKSNKKPNSSNNETSKNSEKNSSNKKIKKSHHNPYDSTIPRITRSMSKKGTNSNLNEPKTVNELINNSTEMESEITNDTTSITSNNHSSDNDDIIMNDKYLISDNHSSENDNIIMNNKNPAKNIQRLHDNDSDIIHLNQKIKTPEFITPNSNSNANKKGKHPIYE